MIGAVCGDEPHEPDTGDHAFAHGPGPLGNGIVAGAGEHGPGDPIGRRQLVRLVAPAIVEHGLVAPFVPVLLEESGEEGKRGVIWLDGGLGERRLEPLEDGGGILEAFALGGDDQRHERQPGMGVEFSLGVGRSRQPLVGDPLVTKIGPNLRRVRREFRAKDAIASHELSPNCEGPTLPATVGQWQDAWVRWADATSRRNVATYNGYSDASMGCQAVTQERLPGFDP